MLVKNVDDDVEKLIKIHQEIALVLDELKIHETGINKDYSDVITDLHWNKVMLENRLKKLKFLEKIGETGVEDGEIL